MKIKPHYHPRWLIMWLGILFWVSAHVAPAQYAGPTLPHSLNIRAEWIDAKESQYDFDVVLSDYRMENGSARLRVSVSITKVSGRQIVKIRDIIQYVAADASSFMVMADGSRFVLDACYPSEPYAEGEIRYITTTFGKMFAGGRIGLVARLAE